jgi:hypothetical protein
MFGLKQWGGVYMGLEELNENIGGIVNYYGGASCNFE